MSGGRRGAPPPPSGNRRGVKSKQAAPRPAATGPRPRTRPASGSAAADRAAGGAATDVVYGVHAVAALLAGEASPVAALWVQQEPSSRLLELMAQARQRGIAVQTLSRRQLQQQLGEVPHQGIAAALPPFAYAELAALQAAAAPKGAAPLLVALDQVQDPHNVGSLVRSAYFLGASGLLLPQDRACAVTAAVQKTAAGACTHLPIAKVVNLARALQHLQQGGFTVVGSMPAGTTPLWEVDLVGPTVWGVGGEAKGIRPLVQRQCDHLVTIPMPSGYGSLGAAAAGAICLYESARQRGGGP